MVGAGKGRLGALTRLFGSLVRSRVLRQPIIVFIASGPFKENLTVLRDLIEQGKVTPIVDRTYPLELTPEALTYLETERAGGKVVIKVSP
jgi:NADPH:quinone reductase-like Zn-dependent oxidoreductase